MGKILVIGAGAWGTALANILAKKNNDVYIWARNPNVFSELIINFLIKNILKIYSYQKN